VYVEFVETVNSGFHYRDLYFRGFLPYVNDPFSAEAGRATRISNQGSESKDGLAKSQSWDIAISFASGGGVALDLSARLFEPPSSTQLI
jgi:hypothetical protein